MPAPTYSYLLNVIDVYMISCLLLVAGDDYAVECYSDLLACCDCTCRVSLVNLRRRRQNSPRTGVCILTASVVSGAEALFDVRRNGERGEAATGNDRRASSEPRDRGPVEEGGHA
jgi:hypothetical protein